MNDLQRLLDEAGQAHRATRYPGDLTEDLRRSGRGLPAVRAGRPGRGRWIAGGSPWSRAWRVAALVGLAVLAWILWSPPRDAPPEAWVTDAPPPLLQPVPEGRARSASPPTLVGVGWPTQVSATKRLPHRLSLSEAGSRPRKPAAWRPKVSLFSHPPRRAATPPAADDPAEPSGTSQRLGPLPEITI